MLMAAEPEALKEFYPVLFLRFHQCNFARISQEAGFDLARCEVGNQKSRNMFETAVRRYRVQNRQKTE